jgi:GNAT superfamily N-acetyltransferase
MNLKLRAGAPDDAATLGRICYEAFRTISEKHNFPPDFPNTEVAAGLMSMMLSRPDVYSVVAENGRGPLGSNFLWEGDAVAGVGPITIDPDVQDSGIGRALMEDVIRRADEREALSVRLVQAAFHNRSLSLYTKLGFDTVEPLSNMQGEPLNLKIDGCEARKMTIGDLAAAGDLCYRIHHHTRSSEVAGAVEQGTATVVERDGRITAYATMIGFFGHAVGETNEDLKALIAAAESFPGPGFLLPTRNAELMRWCLQHGLKVVQPLTLMSRGFYQEPRGAFLPSILF